MHFKNIYLGKFCTTLAWYFVKLCFIDAEWLFCSENCDAVAVFGQKVDA